MNTPYLIPANSKRSQLIFSLFRGVDLLIFSIGAGLTLILLLLISESTFNLTILKLAPVAITGFFVMPFPNYHNGLTSLTEIYNYYFVNRRVYLWRGWCLSDGSEETSAKQSK